MILIGGASAVKQNGVEPSREKRQGLIATPFREFAHAVEHSHLILFCIEMTMRNSIHRRPGTRCLDMSDDITLGEAEDDTLRFRKRFASRRAGPRAAKRLPGLERPGIRVQPPDHRR